MMSEKSCAPVPTNAQKPGDQSAASQEWGSREASQRGAGAGKRGRQPEDISVHELPPRLLLLLPLEVRLRGTCHGHVTDMSVTCHGHASLLPLLAARLLHVARHVVLEDAHQDNGEEACAKDTQRGAPSGAGRGRGGAGEGRGGGAAGGVVRRR